MSDKPIAIYEPFRADIALLVEENAKLVFDYASEKGQKAARSHVHKLRQTKTPIKEAHKSEKAASLMYGRQVDNESNILLAALDEMIDQHMKPINELKEQEAQRIADINAQIDYIKSFEVNASMPSGELKALHSQLNAVVVDDSFAEFEQLAHDAKSFALTLVTDAIASSEKREADEVELARLRDEAAEREQSDRDERIAKEAAKAATDAAEAATAKAAEESAARETAEREAKERAISDARLADERAANAADNARKQAQRELEDAAQAERDATAKREADTAHKKTINNQAVADLIEHAGVSKQTAKMVVTAIASGKVRNTSIAY